MRKCDRCHGQFDGKELSRVVYYRQNKIIYLCDCCYRFIRQRFIRQRFDDDIEEYILRKE